VHGARLTKFSQHKEEPQLPKRRPKTERRSMTLWQGWRATTPDAAVAAGGWGLVGA